MTLCLKLGSNKDELNSVNGGMVEETDSRDKGNIAKMKLQAQFPLPQKTSKALVSLLIIISEYI